MDDRWKTDEDQSQNYMTGELRNTSTLYQYYNINKLPQQVGNKFGKLFAPQREKTCLQGLQKSTALTSLPIHAVWSEPLLFAYWKYNI